MVGDKILPKLTGTRGSCARELRPEILEQERYPRERTGRQPGARCGTRVLVKRYRDSVDVGLPTFRPADRRLQNLRRRHLAASYQCRQPRRIVRLVLGE